MKKSMLIVLICMCSMSCFAQNYRLHSGLPDFEGQRFDIDLKDNCPEGEMDCDDVSYDGINKKTGARLHLKGRVITNYYSHDFRGMSLKMEIILIHCDRILNLPMMYFKSGI
ncbi:hypothetical protein [Rahnella sp. PCH160]|uniref:hypothetical protein n=1 Tax=Rahnella sp. PCH160 TaxID=3447928 RepID=UPI0039FD273B